MFHSPTDWIEEHIDALCSRDSFRATRTACGVGAHIRIAGRAVVNFSSNDYLDLAGDPRLADAGASALETVGAGAGASQLMCGRLDLHAGLERLLAEWLGFEAALLLGSGFLANVGVTGALVSRGDLVLADRLAHASIIDGVRLSGARLRRFTHNDPTALGALLARYASSSRRVLVVTESVFSMDGDVAPLAEIAGLARRYGAMLFIDEAHAIGVCGPRGAGLAGRLPPERRPDIVLGTFGKALGGYGAFVACSGRLRDYLVNSARTYIYSTALPPSAVATATAACRLINRAPRPGMGARLLARCARLRQVLRDAGFSVADDATPIISVVVGENGATLALSERLFEDGILAVAIRPPTVPAGTSRLRLSVTLGHTDDDLARLVASLVQHAPSEVRR